MSIDSISTAQRIDLSQIKRLDSNPCMIRKSTPEEIAGLTKLREMALAPEYSHIEGPPDAIYAEVKVGGKTVATLYNSGAMMTSNALGGRVQNLASVKDSTLAGPALAKECAAEIAALLHGSIVPAKTALTQAAWENTPKQRLVTDWEALRRDPRLAGAYAVQADTLIQAQLMGRSALKT